MLFAVVHEPADVSVSPNVRFAPKAVDHECPLNRNQTSSVTRGSPHSNNLLGKEPRQIGSFLNSKSSTVSGLRVERASAFLQTEAKNCNFAGLGRFATLLVAGVRLTPPAITIAQ
jgi:hypothetical protein